MKVKKNRKYLLWGVLGIVFLAVAFPQAPTYLLGGFFQPCVADVPLQDVCVSQSSVRKMTCSNGFISNTETECAEGEKCSYGVCLQTKCSTDNKVCSGEYSYVQQSCTSGEYMNSLKLCQQGQTCKNGLCSSTSAGTSGILSNWDALYAEVAANPQLLSYTECSGTIDCDSQGVKELGERIMIQYNVKTPREYVDAVAAYLYPYITYKFDGGVRQCGETAGDLIYMKESTGQVLGNCVDYSTVSAALLRYKKIPTEMIGGCVTFDTNCLPLAITPEELRFGGLNSEQTAAHAYNRVYLGQTEGWQIFDATVGRTVSKCSGYLDRQVSADSQVCYLPFGYDSATCKLPTF